MNYHVLKHLSKAQICMAAILAAAAAMLTANTFFGPIFYTNRTASAPRGIYLAVPGQVSYGDYAIVASPASIPDIHIQQGDLLLKKAAAFPGDSYEMTASRLAVNGRVYPVYHLPYLPTQPAGSYAVPEGTILFLNDPVISLDSRYFGPIPQANIKKKVILLVNYDAIHSYF